MLISKRNLKVVESINFMPILSMGVAHYKPIAEPFLRAWATPRTQHAFNLAFKLIVRDTYPVNKYWPI